LTNFTSLKLNYQLTKAEKTMPLVILLHGLFGSLDNLTMLRRELEKDFQVLSIDLPDHGRSEFSTSFSFEHYAQHIALLMDELAIAQAHVVGHSLGGKIAMCLALTHPQKVSKLVLADIAPVAYPPRHQAVFAGLNAVDLANLQDRAEAKAQLALHIEEEGVRQFLLKSLYQQDNNWHWRFNLAMLQRDYTLLCGAIESAHSFNKPVLFIKGGLSEYLLPQHKAHIDRLFPQAQAKIIQGTGHWLHAEKPVIFNRLVSDFLQQ
jgi:esterase